MDSLKHSAKNISDLVGRMTPSQVMMLFGVIAGSIVGIVFVVGWLNSVSYARLYSNLQESEAGEVANYLSDKKIPFKLVDNGTSIEVPQDQVYKVRLELASQGLPTGGNVGYSIFDKNNLGMTDFLQNLNFRRALEGELTKTIMELREVKAARVHIVMPKDRLFREDKKEATASVVLKLGGAGTLTKQQLAGITHLVASSVEGLRPENISIIDYDGNLLTSGQGSDRLAGLSSSQLDVRQQVESYLEDKAQTMLDGVLGPGKAIVRLTADLNFQQLERTAETYDPNSPSVRSEEKTTSTSSAADKAKDVKESNQEDNTQTVVTNYELNKTVEHIINAIGTIDRLSIAVLVDGSYPPVEGADGGAGEKVYQPRPQEELDRLAAIVRNAVGFDQQRNDQLEIVNIPFDRQEIESDRLVLDQMYTREFYWDIGKKIGLALLAIIAFLYLRKKSKKLFTAIGKAMPAPMPQTTVRATSHATGGQTIEDEEDVPPIVPEKRKPRLVDHMQKTAKDRPDEIAKVIKTMMIE